MLLDDDTGKLSNRKEKSEAKRLASFSKKRQLERERQAVISEMLKNVDAPVHCKKIRFDSDSETNGISYQPRTDRQTVTKLKLFDDEGRSSDGENIEDKLNVVNRHFGTKGEKLTAMEAKYGNDSRFRLDEKFLDESDDGEQYDTEALEREQEKKMSLSILSKVLGRNIFKDSKKSTRSEERNSSFIRFDPENEEHLRWLQSRASLSTLQENDDAYVNAEKIGKKGTSEEKRFVEERVFDVDTRFTKSLKESNKNEKANPEEGFSFLKSVGRESSPTKTSRKEKSLQEFVETSFAESAIAPSASARTVTLESPPSSSSCFFLLESDSTVQSVVANFYRKQPVEEVRKKWASVRESIVKIYKGQRKRALKRKKEELRSDLQQKPSGLAVRGSFTNGYKSGKSSDGAVDRRKYRSR